MICFREQANMESKYAPIRTYLEKSGANVVPMTFAEVERVLGFKLPASKRYPAWWSNNPTNNVMTRQWLAAGYQSENVNVKDGKLDFRRTARVDPPGGGGGGNNQGGARERRRHPLFGWMKGSFVVAPGTDLTEPAAPEWADQVDGVERDDAEDEA
jgi:hypothetical protein